MTKAKNTRTTSQLIDAIGKPDRVARSGSLLLWYYEATDGVVEFKIQNGRVTLGRVDISKKK